MFLNGVATGMGIIASMHKPTLKVLMMECIAYFVAAVGASMRGVVARLTDLAVVPVFAAVTLGFVLRFKFVLKSTSQQVYESKSKQTNFFLFSHGVNYLCGGGSWRRG